MDEKLLREIILEACVDGRLSCAEAHRIAEEHRVHLSAIGRVCNEGVEKIKVVKCLLGCF